MENGSLLNLDSAPVIYFIERHPKEVNPSSPDLSYDRPWISDSGFAQKLHSLKF
jgi:hypothetical protein